MKKPSTIKYIYYFDMITQHTLIGILVLKWLVTIMKTCTNVCSLLVTADIIPFPFSIHMNAMISVLK